MFSSPSNKLQIWRLQAVSNQTPKKMHVNFTRRAQRIKDSLLYGYSYSTHFKI